MNNKSIVYCSLLCAMCCSFLFKESALCIKNNKTAVECNQVQEDPVVGLLMAINANDSRRVASALDECSVQEANTAMQGSSVTPFWYAISSQLENSVAALLASNKIDVNKPISGNVTALEHVVDKKDIKMLKLLLACERVNVNTPMADGITAFAYAVLSGNIELLNTLLACERVHVNVPIWGRYRALEFAICVEKPAILKALLKRKDLDITGTGPKGLTPLETANNVGNHEIIKLLEDELERRYGVVPPVGLPMDIE